MVLKRRRSLCQNRKHRSLENFREKENGITGQRKILLDVILEGNWPVVRRFTTWLLKRTRTIGLATVYRMVGVLEEMGFLSRGYRYSYPVENKIS